jgi:hypothetical protein
MRCEVCRGTGLINCEFDPPAPCPECISGWQHCCEGLREQPDDARADSPDVRGDSPPSSVRRDGVPAAE